MNPVAILNKEHMNFADKLNQLNLFVEEEEINIPAVSHLFKEIIGAWNIHEEKENKFFNALAEHGFEFPSERIFFEHRELRGHKKVINDAIKSGSEINVEIALDTDGRMLMEKLQKHIDFEEKIFSEIPDKILNSIRDKFDKNFNKISKE